MKLLTRGVILFIWSTLAVGQENVEDPASITLKGANQFATKLYEELALTDSGNVFFSPMGVNMVLAMTYVGAGGFTEEQLARGLNVPNNKSIVEAGYKGLVSGVKESKRDVTLELQNRLYVYEGGDVKPEYQEKIKDVFKSEVITADFKNNPEATAADINSWASEATHGKIKKFINADTLKGDPRLIALNAIYFYGKWLFTFNKAVTQKEKFYLNAKSTVDTDMMYQEGRFPYSQFPTFQALKLYYTGRDSSMLILLPTEKDGLQNLEAQFRELNFDEINSRLYESKVHVTFPKFRMETSMSLKPTLMKMGVSDIFGLTANFSPMAKKDLYLWDIVQKAFVEVTEEGTEAAAVTGGSFFARPGPPEFRAIFRADHPFIFVIQDEVSKAILFMGRYAKPQ